MTTTIDGLLNKRVWVEQPKKGYRIAIDTLLLASAIPAKAGERVLDLGCGVGGALLVLAARVSDVTGLGIEIQPDLADLCQKNIIRNGREATLALRTGDLKDLKTEGLFAHIFANPPFHDLKRHDASPLLEKRKANADEEGDLRGWIAKAAELLEKDGTFTLIHRGDREEEVTRLLRTTFSTLKLCRICPHAGDSPKRILYQASFGQASFGGEASEKDLILHEKDGAYTAEARALLWEAKALVF